MKRNSLFDILGIFGGGGLYEMAWYMHVITMRWSDFFYLIALTYKAFVFCIGVNNSG